MNSVLASFGFVAIVRHTLGLIRCRGSRYEKNEHSRAVRSDVLGVVLRVKYRGTRLVSRP